MCLSPWAAFAAFLVASFCLSDLIKVQKVHQGTEIFEHVVRPPPMSQLPTFKQGPGLGLWPPRIAWC